MKWLLITLLIFPLGLFAQKKLSINCAELKSKLQQLEKSYKSFEKWKKQKVDPESEYDWTTDYTFCGVKGILEIYDDQVGLVFKFEGYEATKAEREAYVKKLSNAITQVFDHLVYRYKKTDGIESDDLYSHYWADHRISSAGEEVELSYSDLKSPLVLTFTFKK